MLKYLFSDMDGTLLNSKGEVSLAAIKEFNKLDKPVSLVSARAPMEMEDALSWLKTDSIHVAFNGGLIFKREKGQNKILHKKYLQFSVARELVLQLRKNFPKLSISVYDEHNWNTDKVDSGIKYEQNITKKDYKIVNFNHYFTKYKEVFKLMLITFDEEEIEKISKFLKTYSDYDISFLRSNKSFLEITHKYATKAAGIEYIKVLNNLDKSEIVAFGDGHNDIPMFNSVGHVVVMNNALDEIKKYAQYITKSNDEDGIAYAIKKYVRALS